MELSFKFSRGTIYYSVCSVALIVMSKLKLVTLLSTRNCMKV